MGRKGQAALGAGAHEEEFAELQRRFDALSSAKKLSETSPALLTKDMYRTEKKQQAVRRDDPQLHAQLKTLDEQIVQLRRRHDRLHDNNNKKRRELDLLADRLQDLHNSAFKSEDAPQVRLRAQEERLVAAAHRYEESHRTKLTYEQVIERLKTEQLSWPEEVKALSPPSSRRRRTTSISSSCRTVRVLLLCQALREAERRRQLVEGGGEGGARKVRVPGRRRAADARARAQRAAAGAAKQTLATELEKNEQARARRALGAIQARAVPACGFPPCCRGATSPRTR